MSNSFTKTDMMITTLPHKPCRPTLAAGLSSRCAALCFIVFFVVASICATEVHAQIKEYKNSVFTNEGQSTVQGFQQKLQKAVTALQAVNGLIVYVGHHGDKKGDWCADFDNTEEKDVLGMAKMFRNAKLIRITKPGLTDSQIISAVKGGNVFFTWCDSDTRVKKVMGSGMPAFVQSFVK